MKKETLFIYLFYVFSFIAGMALFLRFLLLFFPEATVTSWYRSPEKNRSVGGVPRSAHLFGWAADLVPVTSMLESKLRKIFPFVLNEGDHIHIGWY